MSSYHLATVSLCGAAKHPTHRRKHQVLRSRLHIRSSGSEVVRQIHVRASLLPPSRPQRSEKSVLQKRLDLNLIRNTTTLSKDCSAATADLNLIGHLASSLLNKSHIDSSGDTFFCIRVKCGPQCQLPSSPSGAAGRISIGESTPRLDGSSFVKKESSALESCQYTISTTGRFGGLIFSEICLKTTLSGRTRQF